MAGSDDEDGRKVEGWGWVRRREVGETKGSGEER